MSRDYVLSRGYCSVKLSSGQRPSLLYSTLPWLRGVTMVLHPVFGVSLFLGFKFSTFQGFVSTIYRLTLSVLIIVSTPEFRNGYFRIQQSLPYYYMGVLASIR